jgi:hypothetical protein
MTAAVDQMPRNAGAVKAATMLIGGAFAIGVKINKSTASPENAGDSSEL